MKYALCAGNPVDGFWYVGPFDDAESVILYMETERSSENMWVIELAAPACSSSKTK